MSILHRRIVGVATAAIAATAALAAAPATAVTKVDTLKASSGWRTGSLSASATMTRYTFKPTKTGYHLVTLGDLTRDFALRITDSKGKQLTSSDRVLAKAFEQVVYRFVAGRSYQIRVASKRKEAGNFSLRALPLRSGVYVLDQGRVSAASGSQLVGRIVNNTDKYVTISNPGFDYFDKQGKKLTATTLAHTAMPVLRPHGITAFAERHTPGAWHSARISWQPDAQITSQRPISSGISVTNLPSEHGTGRHITITNKTNSAVAGYANLIQWGVRGSVVNIGYSDGTDTGGLLSAAAGETDDTNVSFDEATTWGISYSQTQVALATR